MSKHFVPGDVVRRVEFVKAIAWHEFCKTVPAGSQIVVESVHGDKIKVHGSSRHWTAAFFELVPGVRAKHLSQQPDPLEDNVNPNNIDYDGAIAAAELHAQKRADEAAAAAKHAASLRQQKADLLAEQAAEDARIAALDADLALLEATRHLLQGIKLASLTLPKQAVPFRKELQPLANKHGYKLVLIGDGTTIALCKLNVKA